MLDALETKHSPLPTTLSGDIRSLQLAEGESITLHELLEKTGAKGIFLLIILLNVPFLLPIPIPNLSTPFGVALLVLGSKLIFGIPRRLPEFVGKRVISAKTLNSILDITLRGVKRIEKIIHPRLPAITEKKIFLYLNNTLLMGMALILTLPLGVPFTNFFPAWTIILITLGILEKDGLLVLLGYLFTLITMFYFYLIYLFGAMLMIWGKELFSRF